MCYFAFDRPLHDPWAASWYVKCSMVNVMGGSHGLSHDIPNVPWAEPFEAPRTVFPSHSTVHDIVHRTFNSSMGNR